MSIYGKQHYENAAQVISGTRGEPWVTEAELRRWAEKAITLFAADNPPTCAECGARPGEEGSCAAGHLFRGDFNRERFLGACELGEEA